MTVSNELAKVAQYVTVNTSSNVITSNATLLFTNTAQISANGSVGLAGQVLTSNGSTGSAYPAVCLIAVRSGLLRRPKQQWPMPASNSRARSKQHV